MNLSKAYKLSTSSDLVHWTVPFKKQIAEKRSAVVNRVRHFPVYVSQ